jgi:hypothetical protein
MLQGLQEALQALAAGVQAVGPADQADLAVSEPDEVLDRRPDPCSAIDHHGAWAARGTRSRVRGLTYP